MPGASSVWLIRHGETDWNRIKRIQGHIDIPLSEHGFLQAEQLGQRLAREGRIDAVYSSDLVRAHVTANAVARRFDREVILRPGLREMHFGCWEGLSWRQIARRLGKAFGG